MAARAVSTDYRPITALAAAWLTGLLLSCAGCAAAPGTHQASIDSVDEAKVIEAAEKDDFPSAHAP